MTQEAVENGFYVYEASFLYYYRLEWGKWYRSKERKAGQHPFGSFMLNKKWTLDEEFINHMMRFQQVTVQSVLFISVNFIFTFQAGIIASEVAFDEKENDRAVKRRYVKRIANNLPTDHLTINSDEPKPLTMEHFHLPIGILIVGLVLSAIFLLVEIILHRKTNVSMATQEDPRVSQSTAESEVEHKTDG